MTLLKIPAKDIMSKPVIKIDEGRSVQEVGKLMLKNRVGSVIITKKGRPIGIITETDLNKRVIVPSKDPKKLKAKDVMSSPLVFGSPNDDIMEITEKMKKHKIKRIPIVKKKKIVGMLTDTDIARTTPEMLNLLDLRLKLRDHPPTTEEATTSGICEVCGSTSEDLEYLNDQWVCESCRES